MRGREWLGRSILVPDHCLQGRLKWDAWGLTASEKGGGPQAGNRVLAHSSEANTAHEESGIGKESRTLRDKWQ